MIRYVLLLMLSGGINAQLPTVPATARPSPPAIPRAVEPGKPAPRKADPIPPAPVPLAITGADKPVPIPGYADLRVNPTAAEAIDWDVSPDPVQLSEVDAGLRLIFVGNPGTSYTVVVRCMSYDTAAGRVIVRKKSTRVTFGDVAPAPTPGPTPGPAPAPADPLTTELQAAYAAETAANKATQLGKFADVYAHAATLCGDKTLATVGDLYTALASYSASQVDPPPALSGIRAITGRELKTAIGTDASAALDDAKRGTTAAAFNRLYKALKGVKP